MEVVPVRKKLTGVHIRVYHAQKIPENSSSIVRHIIRDIYFESNVVPNLNLILAKINQKKARDLKHLNPFHGNEVPDSDRKTWICGRSVLHRFMKSIGFIYTDKISHYEYTKNRAGIVSSLNNYLDGILQYRKEG